jgi:hypothetical protein
VLNLLNVLPGVRASTSSGPGLFGPQLSTVNGLDLNSVNVTRDGLTTNDTRFSAAGDVTAGVAIPHGGSTGVMSPTTINPDLVGEMRLILSPVDAELGRGNSQIQIQTRSGTNKYSGAVAWNVQNTALNANTWDNNRQVDPRTGQWAPLAPNWRNNHEYTLSLGGPHREEQDILLRVVGPETSPTCERQSMLTCSQMKRGREYSATGTRGSAAVRIRLTIPPVLPRQPDRPIRQSPPSISQENPFDRPSGRMARRTPEV